MYVAPQNGRATAAAVAPTLHVGTYRRTLLAVIIGNPLFTDAEQLRANHNAHECQDAQRLALWTRNVLRVAKEREVAARPTGNILADLQNPAYVAQHDTEQAAPGFKTLTVADAYKAAESLRQAFAAAQPTAPAWATPSQCDEIYALACLPCFTAGEKQHTLRHLPQLTQAQAVREIGSLYATALRRSRLPLHADGSSSLAA